MADLLPVDKARSTHADQRMMVLKNKLNMARETRRVPLVCVLIGCLLSTSAAHGTRAPEPRRPSELRDGQHDFDFNIGTWKAHIRRLLDALAGSNDWVDLNGTVHVRKIWNGRAQLEDIEVDGSTWRILRTGS